MTRRSNELIWAEINQSNWWQTKRGTIRNLKWTKRNWLPRWRFNSSPPIENKQNIRFRRVEDDLCFIVVVISSNQYFISIRMILFDGPVVNIKWYKTFWGVGNLNFTKVEKLKKSLFWRLDLNKKCKSMLHFKRKHWYVL